MTATIQLPALVDVNELLAEAEEDYDWLVPGLLERGDRVIVTGGEGKGKSTLLRQWALQCSLGIHPFGGEGFTPARSLLIDLENSRKQVRRKLKDIGSDLPPEGMFQIATWNGLDLSHPDYRAALNAVIMKVHPDLLIIGPMYKMYPNLATEEASDALASYLDLIRLAINCTIIMESHQPHQIVMQSQKFRPERPFGSSLWLRWPEFGFCLEDDGTLRPWRGARDEREFPEKLIRGDEWPWELAGEGCAICNRRLAGKQGKYCSETCSATGRKRRQRARERLL